MTASRGGKAQVVGQSSGLPVAKPPVSPAVTDRHPEDALTSRPEVCTTLAIVTRCTRLSPLGQFAILNCARPRRFLAFGQGAIHLNPLDQYECKHTPQQNFAHTQPERSEEQGADTEID